MIAAPAIWHLRAAGVSLVLDQTTRFLPHVVYWGADLGDLTQTELEQLVLAGQRQVVANQPDQPVWLSPLPENSHSWTGTPGLEGHRNGRDFSTRFLIGDALQNPTGDDGAQRLEFEAADDAAGLGLHLIIEMTSAGLVRLQAKVTNQGATPYTVNNLTLALPVPQQATQLMDFAGRHGRERAPQRTPFVIGTHLREGRHGRTGADATLLLLAGETGFGFRSGEVWGVHTAWSGNHRTIAERTSGTESILAGGELLLPGEVRLAPGEAYTSPWVFGSYGVGIDELSSRFHRFMRARPQAPRQPRPVTGNCWEAVYFQQRLGPLLALADAFAQVGIERFVLDDGWFKGRRTDRSGLGDWYVDQLVWPGGLHPLVDHVRALGMQFGLWVEPEMINPDSDLARAHPDWILATGYRLPPEQRHQQVLNLGNPAALAYVRGRLDALIDEYRLDYLKWDHNRDLIEAGDSSTGAAGVHAQVLATYSLMDYLKAAHPGLEIESCSSGGSRCDLGVMQHADRMWVSDCTDAHERQQIQRYTGLLLPPELMGAHISADPNHQSWRRLSLGMRAVSALFADLGVEWNIAAIDPADRAELAAWITFYKQWRPLLHSGDVVHIDHPDGAIWAHGVVAGDKQQALFTAITLESSVYGPPGMLRLAGLDDSGVYKLEVPEICRNVVDDFDYEPPPWWHRGLEMSGRALARQGFQLPDTPPDQPLLFVLTRTEGSRS